MTGPILVALSGDVAADTGLLSRAAPLSKQTGAPIVGLAARAAPRDFARLTRVAHLTTEAARTRVSDDALNAAQHASTAAGVPLERIDVTFGRPFMEVIREAHTLNATLVIKHADPLLGSAARIFGSTDQHLLRKCPVPVWLVRELPQTPARILAAVDLDPLSSDEPDTEAALNHAIADAAALLARTFSAELHLIHTWEAPAEHLVRLFGTEEADAADYVRATDTEHRAMLTAFIDATDHRLHLSGKAIGHLRQGSAREAIPAAVEALGIDTLVMGTVARVGVSGLIIGNTAEDILNSVSCSVLTVKPPGYVSPVLDHH